MQKPTVCPYSLKQFDQIENSNEHVIPHALGGPDTFSLIADEKINNDFGSEIDADFVNDHMLKMAAMYYGIKTRSGIADLRFQGFTKLNGAKIPVNLSVKYGGDVTVNPRVPVVPTADGYLVYGTEGEIEKEVKKVLQRVASKGIFMSAHPIESQQGGSAGRLQHSIFKKTRGLLKIGYLALAHTFGDDFVQSSAASVFRLGFQAKDVNALERTNIETNLLPRPRINLDQSGTHRVLAVRGHGAYSAFVTLFQDKLFTRQFSVQDNSVPKNQPRQGSFYTVNPIQRIWYEEAFVPIVHLR